LIALLCMLAASLAPTTGVTGVTVEDEEVIFTLRAPEANDVFLVGDFNNWNPTLEKMDHIGDVFEVRLFLLPGTYRYKFVVDDKWINDPDNPPVTAERGSAIKLVMRSGMLAIGDEAAVVEGGVVQGLKPSLRYTGRSSVDSGRSANDQTLDFYFDYELERIRSRADLTTTDDSWDLSPMRTDIRFNQGYLDLLFDNAKIRAFENEETWTSKDPFRLVGDVGIYDYSAGRGRKGAGVELGTQSKVQLRALYADRVEERLTVPVTIPGADLAGFATSSAPDTTVYQYDPRLEDEDTWALDLSANFGGVRFGYAMRRDRGYHPGVLTTVTRGSGDYTIDTYGTREWWGAGSLWGAWDVRRGLTLEATYGQSHASLRRLTHSQSVVSSLDDIAVGQDAADVDSDANLQQSHRWRGGIRYEDGPLYIGASYDWNRFEFEKNVFASSSADIAVVSVNGGFDADRWRIGATIGYTDQDYGSTPDDFHFYTQARNRWLDFGDDLTVAHMAGFDLARMSEIQLEASWNDADSVQTAHAEIDYLSREFFSSMDYLALRAAVEWHPWWRLYVQGDGRLAVYNSEWSNDAYFAPYVELGYRHRGVELSLGFGLDPVVLDPVTNRYMDNGREEFLRQAIPPVPVRSQAAALGAALAARERLLKKVNAIKLEAIVSF
jgi:hypothetical protein